VRIGPQRRQPKYSPPEPRACEYCGDSFKPPFPSSDARRVRRFCSDDHARRARAENVRELLDERGLLSTGDLVERFGTDRRVVINNIIEGRLAAEEIKVPGALRPISYGVSEREAARFEREWRNGGDGRRAFSWVPERVVERSRGDGATSTSRVAG